MLQGRPVAVLGGVRIPFCRQNTAYADVGNLGMSVRTLGALVEKFGLHGQQLGEVAMGAVIKHSSDWNLGREATLSSGLSPLTPGITLQRACGTSLDSIITVANKIATGQIEAGIGGGSDTTSDVPIVYGKKFRRRLLAAAMAQDAARQARRVQGFPSARAEAGLPRRRRAAHRQVDGRPLRGHGQAVEHLARFAGRARGRLAPQAGRGLRARVLRRPGGQLPRRGARQHPARRYLAGEAGDAEAGVRQDLRPRHADRRQLDAADRRRRRRACSPPTNGRARTATSRCATCAMRTSPRSTSSTAKAC